MPKPLTNKEAEEDGDGHEWGVRGGEGREEDAEAAAEDAEVVDVEGVDFVEVRYEPGEHSADGVGDADDGHQEGGGVAVNALVGGHDGVTNIKRLLTKKYIEGKPVILTLFDLDEEIRNLKKTLHLFVELAKTNTLMHNIKHLG